MAARRRPALSPLGTIGIVVLAILALGFLTWAHHAFWGWYLAPADRPDEIHHVRTDDGWTIALRRYRPRGEGPIFREPVILCHGLGANHFNLYWDPPWGLAQYLADRGHDCWVISLRGHDGSDRPDRRRGRRWGFTFDDYLRHDVPAAIGHVLRTTGEARAQWVGHSMGGILAYALAGTEWEERLGAGIVAVASPASFSHQRYLIRWARVGTFLCIGGRLPQRWITRMIAPFTGHFEIPFSELVIAPKSMEPQVVRRLQANAFEDISEGVMRQFDDWVRNDTIRSFDRSIDYGARLAALRVPILLVGGSKDRMAPPGCMRAAFERIGSEAKRLILFGREFGSQADYGHGDLLLGRRAPAEVFPAIEAWLRERATERREGTVARVD